MRAKPTTLESVFSNEKDFAASVFFAVPGNFLKEYFVYCKKN